ncbi:response regulator [Sulfurimonas sp.]|uniref:response regulator n=1 Tax=Sulfurimonas sp. TaxID=2022749 RepID=UPI003D14C550
MVEELLNNLDLIGIAVAVILLIGLVVYKISRKKSPESLIDDELDKELQSIKLDANLLPDEYDETQDEITQEETTQKNVEEMDIESPEMGSEEGDFGVDEEQGKQEPQDDIESTTIHKRDVPPHAKITKENFQEFAGQRILLAEDNLINQKVIMGLLADSGIEIIIANDGQEALNILENDTNFMLILMDAHMPIMDGFEATRQIRANNTYNHIVVVALSGDTAADDIRKMNEAGMAEHLEKPLKMDALYDIFYAYSSENDKRDENEPDTIIVVSTKELDGEKGLDICGGDEVFYHEILSEFLQTYSDSDETLISMLEAGQLQEADRLLLDIVGVSANIGAIRLNETATTIKDSLSDSEEKSYLTLMQQYQHHLKRLLQDIKEYLR